MYVSECDIPTNSALDRTLVDNADYHDSYSVRLSHLDLDVVDIFYRIFAHLPFPAKALLIIRNKLASLIGLEAPTASEVLHVQIKNRDTVGDKIGVWPIFFLGENELVAGRDNKHMDFRLSVLKVSDGGAINVVVTTVCTVRNRFGKYYLRTVVPFHRRGLQRLLSNAVAANRL
jgi:hypothetical protein